MYWTLELASYLEDAPWPATKDELIDFAMRTGAPLEVVENLQAIEDDEESLRDPSRTSGRTTRARRTSSSTRTSTEPVTTVMESPPPHGGLFLCDRRAANKA
jgi:hypothetical protein